MSNKELTLTLSHCERLSEALETALERMRRDTWSSKLALYVQQDLQTALTLLALEYMKEDRGFIFPAPLSMRSALTMAAFEGRKLKDSKEDRDLALTTEQATG